MNNQNTQAIVFGEILFDLFEDGDYLGGAPLNFAWYLRQFGISVAMVSAIGQDELALRVKLILQEAGIQQKFVSIRTKPTGTVVVKLTDGQPDFTIKEDVAWDFIELPSELNASSELLYFGTLAQRTAMNRATLKRLLLTNPSHRFFDVNLRQHFFSEEIVLDGLRNATIVKFNEEEWSVIREITSQETPGELVNRFSLQALVLTRGSKGASLYNAEKEYHAVSPTVEVVDTVGAGDAFSAAIAAAAIYGVPLEQALPFANEVGAFVVGQRGAQAELPEQLRRKVGRQGKK